MKQLITWEEMTRLEPRLETLYRRVCTIKDPGGSAFCANACWYGYGGHPSLKEPMTHLVGFDARNPQLRTMEAYNLAYQKLYSALPDCRNCMCL
jgi:hypothetical protein